MSKKTSINVDEVMESYQKNLDAIATASKMASENLQMLSQLQARYMKESMDELGGIMKELMAGGGQPQEQMARSQQILQREANRAMQYGTSFAQALSKTNSEVMGVLSKRVEENLKAARNMLWGEKQAENA